MKRKLTGVLFLGLMLTIFFAFRGTQDQMGEIAVVQHHISLNKKTSSIRVYKPGKSPEIIPLPVVSFVVSEFQEPLDANMNELLTVLNRLEDEGYDIKAVTENAFGTNYILEN